MKQLVLILFFLGGASCTPSSPEKKSADSVFVRNMSSPPNSLHPIRATDAYSKIIHDHVLDTLLKRNLDTYEWDPHLAESWKAAKDGKTFTFTIRKEARWHDGRPVRVQDVVFSFKAFKDPSFGGARFVSYFENLESAKILNENTVQFKAHTVYVKNLETLGEILRIIPEHIYKDKEKKLNNTVIGSGPYILEKYDRGKQITLRQNKDWWGRAINSPLHRIKKIIFKFIENENDQLIRIRAGGLDFMGLSSEAYHKKTDKAPWGSSVLKKKIKNKAPAGYSFIAWNLKNPLFQSKKVRRALAYLSNRKLMNEKFQYNQYVLATGPWYPWSDFANPNVKAIPFDPQKAGGLLKAEGWEDTDKDGVLDKIIEGQKTDFIFTLLFPTKDFEKYLTIYQQDLKKSGIHLNLRYMDWPAFIKRIQEKQFAAGALAWTGVMDVDPKQVWHSESARKGGSNMVSYSNPQVDKLIDQARKEINRGKRIKLLRQVYKLIAEDSPYLFFFSNPVRFYAHSNKMLIPKDTFTYGVGLEYWQVQP